MTEHVDVLIVGAGLSGIGAAAQVREHLPGKSVAVLESREVSGGTWDLFRYPGIRSDSDMFTFGFRWRPWPSDTSLADGHLILDYLRTIAEEYDVARLIRYQHSVTSADWSSATNRWTVQVDTPDGERTFTAAFLWSAAGYYDYEDGHQPSFPGLADYEGTFLHPQHWPDDLDYTDQKVVVIGSGATAVTLVPAMAERAEHVTMLQRTPTYIISRPARDQLARRLRKVPRLGPLAGLQERLEYEIVRWANVFTLVGSYQIARRAPAVLKKAVRESQLAHLTAGRSGFTRQEAERLIEEHFTPPYQPWDQRLCAVPDGDFFRAMREGNASVVTDRIRTFTPKGIELESGDTLEADLVISATGLKIRLFGGIEYRVDGEPVDLSTTMSYKAAMLTGLPNFLYTVGYTNASWTLKADLVSDFGVRLLAHMDSHGYEKVEVTRDPTIGEGPFMDLQAGYIQRAADQMPRAGDRHPWRLKQNYLVDRRVMSGGVADDVIQFG